MSEIEVKINFQIWCSECGTGLCGNVSNKGRSGDEFYDVLQDQLLIFQIEPCQYCLKNSYDEGYEVGKENANETI